MKVLLLGATGLVGGWTLKLALAHPGVSRIIAPTRMPLTPADKLVNPVGTRLEELAQPLASQRPDAIICALGTTRAKAGSKEAFRYVDYELPIRFATSARAAGVETYAIVTAMGASTSSRFFYAKTKGEVERDLTAIGFSSLTICRPGLIGGERNEARSAEGVALALLRVLTPILPGSVRINPADAIAASLLDAVIAARPGCRWIRANEMNQPTGHPSDPRPRTN